MFVGREDDPVGGVETLQRVVVLGQARYADSSDPDLRLRSARLVHEQHPAPGLWFGGRYFGQRLRRLAPVAEGFGQLADYGIGIDVADNGDDQPVRADKIIVISAQVAQRNIAER